MLQRRGDKCPICREGIDEVVRNFALEGRGMVPICREGMVVFWKLMN